MRNEFIEILNEKHKAVVTERGIASISTKDFPETYKEQALLAMKEAYLQGAKDYCECSATIQQFTQRVEDDF